MTDQPARVSPEASLDRKLSWRLGCMADAMVSAKVGPQARFFSRERVDEIVLLLREAEKAILDMRQELRVRAAPLVSGEAPAAGEARALPEATPERLIVKCRECGQEVVWTSLYGDWCATCQPRTL